MKTNPKTPNPALRMMRVPDELEKQTAIRLQLHRLGYRPLPTAEKVAFLPGWPSLKIDEKVIASWPMMAPPGNRPAVTTAVQLTGCMLAIDVDVNDAEVAGEIDGLLGDVLGASYEQAPVRDSGGAKFMVLLRTATPFKQWKTPKYLDADGQDHMIEVYGGAATRYFSCFGPHTLGGVEDGLVEVLKEYAWDDGPTPLDTRPEDLALITEEQLNLFLLKATDLMGEVEGWEEMKSTTRGHYEGGVAYDLHEDMTFRVKGDLELTYAEALAYAMDEHDARCSSSFLGDSSGNTSKCRMHVVGSVAEDNIGLAVFDHEAWVHHYPESWAPRSAAERQEQAEEVAQAVDKIAPKNLDQVEMTKFQERKWAQQNLVMNEGKDESYPEANTTNAATVMRLHPAWAGVLAYDAFSQRGLLTKPIPGSTEDNGAPFTGRLIGDTDYTAALIWFERGQLMPQIEKQKVRDALDLVLQESQADTLRQAIENASAAWDGKPRIDRLFSDYFIARDDNAYTRELGRISMVTLVHRAFVPGAFQKMVPILEGPQDIGKSSGLRALCPDPDWFADNIPENLNGKDAAIALRGKFLIELSELSATRRAEQQAVKSFVTRQVEKFRPPYGKFEVAEPRRCMCWGTTNDDNYLRDATGSTRFFPVELTDVDVGRIAADRDQLLGEAAVQLQAALKAGETDWWRFSDAAGVILDGTRREKDQEDPWTGVVLEFLEGRDEVAAKEILTASKFPGGTKPAGLGMTEAELTRGHSDRVADILRKHGWERGGIFAAKPWRGLARFVRRSVGKAA